MWDLRVTWEQVYYTHICSRIFYEDKPMQNMCIHFHMGMTTVGMPTYNMQGHGHVFSISPKSLVSKIGDLTLDTYIVENSHV